MIKLNDQKLKVYFIVVIGIIMLFAFNVVASSSLKQHELDLTEDHIFALSPGTKNIISEINEPLTLRYFYSRHASNGFPLVKSYAERIRGILQRYATISGGKIQLEIIDPEAFSEEEDLAVSYGIKGIDLQDQNKLYLGLAVSNSSDETRAIPFFHPDRQRFVEYEVTKAIYDVLQKKRPVIGLLSTLQIVSGPMMGIPGLGGGKSWLFLEQLKQSFDVVDIEKTANKIPDGIDILMVVQPKNFNADLLSSIDQYVLAGGKAVVFADPNQEGAGVGNSSERSFSGDFNRLLGAWGVNIATNTIVADRKAARPVKTGPEAAGKVDYIAWLDIEKDGLNQEDITTSMLKNINFATAGSITDLKKSGIEVTPLIHTSKESMRINSSIVQGTPDPNKLLSNFVSDNKEYNLAVRISGKAETAFPEKNSESGHLAQSSSDINVIVIADTDILRDDTWAQVQDIQGYKVVMQNGDNNSFIYNIADLLSGSSDLVSLRGRGASQRPFKVVDDLKKKAEERYLAKEKALKDQLAETESHLAQLKKQAEAQAGSKLVYQSQQQQAISAFTEQLSQTRQELRSVQFELKKGVEKLGSVLKFINIALMPLLITMFAIFIFWSKNSMRKKGR